MLDRTAAQRRVNQIEAFRVELEALKAAGQSPLTAEQEAALTAYHDRVLRRLTAEYDIDRTERAGQLSFGMRLVSFFGAVTLTAAIYSLVERFWGGLDLPLQATLLAAFPLTALIGVELSARRERTLYVASLCGLVAYGSFWLAVNVLSHLLNVPVVPLVIWAGVVFGFGLALPYKFRVIFGIALVALAVALPASLFALAGIEWLLVFERLDLITAAGFSLVLLGFPLAQVDRSFPAVTRLVGFFIGLLGLLVLSSDGSMSLLPASTRTAEGIYQVLMFITCIGALVVSVRLRWRESVRVVSVMFTLFLVGRYLDWFWDLLPRYLFFLILATAAFVGLLVLRRLRARVTELA